MKQKAGGFLNVEWANSKRESCSMLNRSSVFANWFLPKLGSYPPIETRRQGPYLSR